jgi:hypothetical protein
MSRSHLLLKRHKKSAPQIADPIPASICPARNILMSIESRYAISWGGTCSAIC